MSQIKSVNITIKGKVQNVGFRYHTKEKAQNIGVLGFVKNMANGNVYIEAEASEHLLTQFIAWCYHGPNWARVDDVYIANQPVVRFENFEVRR